jgi:hypothetical protein
MENIEKDVELPWFSYQNYLPMAGFADVFVCLQWGN